jgi:hemerythrin-like domain-containing protein
MTRECIVGRKYTMESTLIRDLSEEHRSIERLLASLLRIVAKASVGDAETKALLARHLELFRALLDSLHHGREEDILFEALAATGMSRVQGPVAVMLSEHELGRKCVLALGDIASAAGPLMLAELTLLRRHASAFVELLSSHIAKEDNILYPMARARLGEFGLTRIDAAATAWSRHSRDERARLMALVEQLSQATLGDHGTREAFRAAAG